MNSDPTTLVMAGAREAHSLVIALHARGRGRSVIASLPEKERMFGNLPVPTRVGRFETPDALAGWMEAQNVDTVLDASHVFDSDISAVAGDICSRIGIRYLRILRPPWRATSQDQWRHAPSVRQAMKHIPSGARVFSNTGWTTVPEYEAFPGDRLFMRQTHTPFQASPFDFMEFVEGHPPFTQFEEQRLFAHFKITHLICRNVGGAASMSKLLAARAMALPVILIERHPVAAHLPVVETVAEALAWEANR